MRRAITVAAFTFVFLFACSAVHCYTTGYEMPDIDERQIELGEKCIEKGVYHFELGGPGSVWGDEGDDVGRWTADFYGVEMKQAYIDFKVPGTDAFPIRATVGVQPWVFSPQLISDEDGPGVQLATTVGPAAVKVGWAKMYEGADYQSDDIDRYTATATFPVGPMTAGIWSSYYKMR